MARNWTSRLVTWVAVLFIASATLVPVSNPGPGPSRQCLLFCGQRDLADALVNIVLYLPLGVGLRLLGLRTRVAILAAFLLAAAVEAAQVPIPGRDASVSDVITNALGTGLGYSLTATAAVWLNPTRPMAQQLTLAWSVFVALVVSLTGVLTSPSLPSGDWFGQWTPDFGHLEHYEGEVLSARVAFLETPPWQLQDADSLRSLLQMGAPVEVVAVAGPPPVALAPIFSITNHRRQTVIMIGADGTDLRVTIRQRSIDFHLDTPDLRLREWFADVARGDTMTIRMWRDEGGICIQLNTRTACRLGYTAGRGWAIFYWLPNAPAWAQTSLDVLWIGLLLFPFGLWFVNHRLWGASLGIAIAALGFLPVLTGLRPTGPVEFMAAAIGLGAGWLVRLLTQRSQPKSALGTRSAR